MEKVAKLDEIDKEIINVSSITHSVTWALTPSQAITSLVSLVSDGWSSKRRRHFSSFSIQYIDSPPEDPLEWVLKSFLIDFRHCHGRQTGIAIGKELVVVLKKFGLEEKVCLSP